MVTKICEVTMIKSRGLIVEALVALGLALILWVGFTAPTPSAVAEVAAQAVKPQVAAQAGQVVSASVGSGWVFADTPGIAGKVAYVRAMQGTKFVAHFYDADAGLAEITTLDAPKASSGAYCWPALGVFNDLESGRIWAALDGGGVIQVWLWNEGSWSLVLEDVGAYCPTSFEGGIRWFRANSSLVEEVMPQFVSHVTAAQLHAELRLLAPQSGETQVVYTPLGSAVLTTTTLELNDLRLDQDGWEALVSLGGRHGQGLQYLTGEDLESLTLTHSFTAPIFEGVLSSDPGSLPAIVVAESVDLPDESWDILGWAESPNYQVESLVTMPAGLIHGGLWADQSVQAAVVVQAGQDVVFMKRHTGVGPWVQTVMIPGVFAGIADAQVSKNYACAVGIVPYVHGQQTRYRLVMACQNWVTPPGQIQVEAPTSVQVNASVKFEAHIEPEWTQTPITWTWNFGPGLPWLTHSGGVTDVVTVTFPVTGIRQIVVSAQNQAGTITQTVNIDVRSWKVYLPYQRKDQEVVNYLAIEVEDLIVEGVTTTVTLRNTSRSITLHSGTTWVEFLGIHSAETLSPVIPCEFDRLAPGGTISCPWQPPLGGSGSWRITVKYIIPRTPTDDWQELTAQKDVIVHKGLIPAHR